MAAVPPSTSPISSTPQQTRRGRVRAQWCSSSKNASTPSPSLRSISVSGTPFEMGREIGREAADLISARVQMAPMLQNKMIPFSQTAEGSSILRRLCEPLRSQFPSYWLELEGMAEGSGRPFQELLLLNLRHELRQFLPKQDTTTSSVEGTFKYRSPAETRETGAALSAEGSSRESGGAVGGGGSSRESATTVSGEGSTRVSGSGSKSPRGGATTAGGDGSARASGSTRGCASGGASGGTDPDSVAADNCSDVALLSHSQALIAHNEDADFSLRGHTFMVHAEPSSGPGFSAYTYAGELPTICFGFNSVGIGFTADAVTPMKGEIDLDGVARTFVGRSLLEASTLEEALQRICLPNLATGHHYMLADFKRQRIVSVETASKGRNAQLELSPTSSTFHANAYMRLVVPQIVSPSNIHREARAKEVGEMQDLDSMLQLLSDTQDPDYPIYSNGRVYTPGGPSIFTLHTAVFDLRKSTVTVLTGRPYEQQELLCMQVLQ